MDVGKRLKEIRQMKNMSIYRLSQISDVSESHIRNLERANKNATVETLELLVRALDISLSEFFNRDEAASYLTSNEKLLLDYFRSLPKDTADAVAEFCEKMTASFEKK